MHEVAIVLGFLLGPAGAGEEAAFSPKEFAQRWVNCTRSVDAEALKSLFVPAARLTFEASGRRREATPERYATLLSAVHANVKSFERVVDSVEMHLAEDAPEDTNTARVDRLVIVTSDRIRTREGFMISAENREEFHFMPGVYTQATGYSAKTVRCDTLEKPEDWQNYGGAFGTNGLLVEAHASATPEGVGSVVVAAIIALIIFGKVLHSLGLKKRIYS